MLKKLSVSPSALPALLFTGKHVPRQPQLQEASPENLWVQNKGAVGRRELANSLANGVGLINDRESL